MSGNSKEATGFLAAVERVGNMVPHPAIIFFILIGIVIVLSVIFGLLGTTVTYDGYDPALGDIVEQTSSVRSLLAPDGIRFMLTSPVANFLGFTGVGVILVAMIGVGLAEESGLIATLVRKLVAIAPRSIFTFMIVMVGVLSSIAADAGYLVLVPLAAAAFHSMGRHPLAGLAAGFSGVAAVFLVNVFVTPTDALLVEVTNDAIRAVDPQAQISVVGNLFFMIASSILMGIICTVLTEKFVEPRLGPYTGGVPVEETHGLSGSEQQGLKIRRPRAARLRRRDRPPDRAADPLGHPAQPGDRRHHGGLAVHVRPDHPDQPAVPRRRLRLRPRRRHHRQRDGRDRPDRQDLVEPRGHDLPAVRDRELHRVLQLHEPRDRAGGEPRRLPAERADRRDRLHHPLRRSSSRSSTSS